MPQNSDQADWILRVLGVATHGDGEPPVTGSPGPAADLLKRFMDAKEEVDAGLDKLASALRATDDPDKLRIADFGLFGIGGGNAVRLIAALTEARGAAPDAQPRLLDRARKAAAAYHAALLADKTTALIDANPWGITVGLRGTLLQALAEIESAV
jgi:hypothetical protein